MDKILLDDFTKFKFISGLKANIDKDALVFTCANTDLENNKYQRNLFLYKDNNFKQLTYAGDISQYYWLNNDELLMKLSRDNKEDKVGTSFYKFSILGGEPYKYFDLPIDVNDIKILDENIYILSANIDANNPDFYKLDKQSQDEVLKFYKDNKDYEVFDEVPFWFNGGTFISRKRTALFTYDVSNNQLKRITDPLYNLHGFNIDKQNKKVVYWGNSYDDIVPIYNDIRCYDLNEDCNEDVLIDNQYSVSYVNFYKDSYIAIMSNCLDYGINQNRLFYTVKNNQVNELAYYDNSIGSTVGSDCRLGGGKSVSLVNNDLYFVSTINDSSHLLCLSDDIKKVIEINGSVDDFEVLDDKIIFVAMIDQNLQEIYSYSNGEITKLSNFNEVYLKDKYVAKPKYLSIESEGFTIDGWVLEPKDYDANLKYPAILDIHGGPKTVYGEVYYHEMQVWANMGYFVYYLNPLGSDGKGNKFMDIRGKYGTCDYQNIMDFTDYVLKQYPAIDEENIAVTGGSYGGFMTNWIIGHTDRFKCAATQRSISNWISFYGVSDIGPRFALDQQGVNNLIDNVDKLWFHSPLKYVNNIKTPTLIIHSDEDYRCPMEQAMQLFTSLKVNGIESKLVYFKGENHELSRSGKPLHRIKRLNEITSWIEKYTR